MTIRELRKWLVGKDGDMEVIVERDRCGPIAPEVMYINPGKCGWYIARRPQEGARKVVVV